MQLRPVLYLDLDDTIISWSGGKPAGGHGIRDFLLWCLDTFEVRWLTRWARTGEMEPRLLRDLAKMSGVPLERLQAIRGLSWDETGSKLDGITWLEHILLRRPFLWFEDESIGVRATDFLARHGFGSSHCCCNVTRDAGALERLHRHLAQIYSPAGGEEQGRAP